MTQIELHKKIEKILATGPAQVQISDIQEIMKNKDGKLFFFSIADEKWLDWLWDNGFLDEIKKKGGNPARYGYLLPELQYLVRMVEKDQKKVVDFIVTTNEAENFNPEVVDRFLWICSLLPADQLARVVPQILAENWVGLMSGRAHLSFEYQKMIDTVAAAHDDASLITLAQIVFTVRSKTEIESSSFLRDKPFYVDDLSQTGIFEKLLSVGPDHIEKAFEVITKTFGKIVELGTEKEDDVFDIGEIFQLFDVDFFTISIENDYSHKRDVNNLAAVAKELAQKIIGGNCGTSITREVHDKYVATLPNARTIWRFRLFVWSLCPIVFQTELKSAFNRVFSAGDNFWPIVAGAEYERALKASFGSFSDEEQREYVKNILHFFTEKENRQSFGYDILSSISAYLDTEETRLAEKTFGKKLSEEYVPQPSIGRSYARTIIPQAPPGSEDIWKKSIPEIVQVLKIDWTPEAIRALDKNRDFFHPLSAEGVAEKLKASIKERFTEYLASADLFFDRQSLDAHYTYSFLRGVTEALKGEGLSGMDWGPLMRLFKDIIASGTTDPFTRETKRREAETWLSGWNGVHDVLGDLLKELLSDGQDKNSLIPFDTYRSDLLAMTSYLLDYPDPQPVEHEVGIKKDETTGKAQFTTSDPFTEAINSVRGRTFQALTLFIYQDGKKYTKEKGYKLEDDVKEIYKRTLEKEDTEAVMFLYGHYFASFYYRDIPWMTSLLPQIFPKDKKDLFLAAWEGYLTANLFKELLDVFIPLYEYAISLNEEDYTPRRYYTNLDEGLSNHLALAYMHFPDFGIDHKLFQKFWAKPDTRRHEFYVSFVGRHAVSREQAKAWIQENKVDPKKLETLWDWLLENCNEPSVFAEFGFWINPQAEIFDASWLVSHVRKTLEKSKGAIDWDYQFLRSLPTFVKISPADTLVILNLYLKAMELGPQHRGWMHIDQEMVGIFKELYHSDDQQIKDGMYKLIDELLPLGNGQFWLLKQALE